MCNKNQLASVDLIKEYTVTCNGNPKIIKGGEHFVPIEWIKSISQHHRFEEWSSVILQENPNCKYQYEVIVKSRVGELKQQLRQLQLQN